MDITTDKMNSNYVTEDDMDVEDPLGSVPGSQAGDLWAEAEDVQRDNGRRLPPLVLDAGINLTLTDAGLRQILGRKKQSRPMPLLKIICKGCGRSTHDVDEFLPSDWTEFLV